MKLTFFQTDSMKYVHYSLDLSEKDPHFRMLWLFDGEFRRLCLRAALGIEKWVGLWPIYLRLLHSSYGVI